MRTKVLHTAITFMLAVTICAALKCYQCSSETDPECLENFDTGNSDRFIQAQECDVYGAQYCVKTTGIFGGVVGTRRFCSSRDFDQNCQYVTYPHHDRVYRACVFTCSGDACNAASLIKLSSLLLASSVILLFHFA